VPQEHTIHSLPNTYVWLVQLASTVRFQPLLMILCHVPLATTAPLTAPPQPNAPLALLIISIMLRMSVIAYPVLRVNIVLLKA
jgi:hypothetical protein